MARGLQWWNLHALLSHYQDSVAFGQSEELDELMSTGNFTVPQARAIYEAGYTNLKHLAYANPLNVMNALLHTIDWTHYIGKDKEKEEIINSSLTNSLPPSLVDAQNIIKNARKKYASNKRLNTRYNNQKWIKNKANQKLCPNWNQKLKKKT